MRARYVIAIVFASLLLPCSKVPAEGNSKTVSMIRLIASPDRFDGQRVTVRGFIWFDWHNQAAVLSLDQVQSENMLGGSVLVIPNKEMWKDREKLDNMYVTLTGDFHVVPVEGDSPSLEIKDIQKCSVWSDPRHPVGLKLRGPEGNQH